jgi:hypothetical protein
MNRKRKEAKRRRQAVQVWTYSQAQAALPYVASIMKSLREHQLAAQGSQLEARRLADQPGRPGRETLIAQEEAVRNTHAAEQQFADALEELQKLDVFCLDALAGQALIPFVHDDQLAWYVYDLFDETPLRFWRYHTDPLEMRRPLGDNQKGKAQTAIV